MTMRDFFKSELVSLERKTGLKQYEKILEKDSWERDTDELLNELCKVCNQFHYIPNDDKFKIIRQNILSDQDFQGFNARIIFKWLSGAKSIYFKEIAHIKDEEPEEPKPILEGAARDAMLKKWLESLGEGVKSVPRLSAQEIKNEGKIDVVEKIGVAHEYERTVDPLEWERKHQLHKQYCLENYNPQTGEKLGTWIPESEWLKMN